MKFSFVYIISNKNRTVLYIGVTNDIAKRIQEHKSGNYKGFAQKYNCTDLLYYEDFDDIVAAIAREKQLKNWHKEWKWNLVKVQNPELKDLAAEWVF